MHECCAFIDVRCCAHIVNLVVRDGLNDLNHSIRRIRNAVRYVKSSPSRTQTFKLCVEKVKIDFKGLLCLDVETRWNSTYKMLETAIKFEKAFDRLLEEDSKYFSYFDGDKNIGPPSKEDWKIARVFVKFLKLFYIVTLRFSGSLYVTSNAFFHELMALIDRLQWLMENGDGFLNSMAFQMKMKLEKYWENDANLNYLLFVAVVLDPRFKMAYVRFCFESVNDFIKAKEIGDKVEETLNQLYSHYLTCDPNIELGVNSSSQASEDVDLDDLEEDPILTFQYKYSKHRKWMQRLESQSEVTQYLSETCEEIVEQFDVLRWWKCNASKYPLLSRIAKDVLAIPVSIVASESAFSTGGRILDPFRSSLSPLMVQALICCQNWLKSTFDPINLREAIDCVESFEKLESELQGLCPLIIGE